MCAILYLQRETITTVRHRGITLRLDSRASPNAFPTACGQHLDPHHMCGNVFNPNENRSVLLLRIICLKISNPLPAFQSAVPQPHPRPLNSEAGQNGDSDLLTIFQVLDPLQVGCFT